MLRSALRRHGSATMDAARSILGEAQIRWLISKGETEPLGMGSPRVFRLLRTEGEMQEVLKRLGNRLTAKHVTAAFARLRQLGTDPDRPIVWDLVQRAKALAPVATAQEAVSLLKASSSLRCFDAALLQALGTRLHQRECQLQMNGATVADCLNALFSLQQMGLSPPTRHHFELLQEMGRLSASPGFVKGLLTPDLVSLVFGFGMLRHRSPELQREMAKEISTRERFAEMRFEDLVLVWRAFGALKVQDRLSILVLCDETSRVDRLNGFKATELVSLILATVQLLPFRDWPFLEKLTNEIVKPDRLRSFTEAQLVRIIATLPPLNVKNGAATDLLAEATKSGRLMYYTRQGIFSMLCALRRLGYGSHPNIQILLNAAEEMVDAQCLTEQQLTSFAFARPQSEKERALSAKLIDQFVTPQRLASVSDTRLSSILNGLYERGVKDSTKLQICAAELPKRFQSATPEVLSYYAYGLRVNNITAPDVLHAFAKEVTKETRLKEFATFHLSGILYALASLKWSNARTFDRILKELTTNPRLSQLCEKGLTSVVRAIQLSRKPFDSLTDAVFGEATHLDRLLQMGEQGLISLVISFSRMRVREKRWIGPLYEEITKAGRLARMTDAELAGVVYHLPRIRAKTTQGIDKIKRELLTPQRMEKMEISKLAALVFGLGELQIQEEELIRAAESRVIGVPDVTALKSFEVVNLIYGLAGMGCQNEDILSKLLQDATKEARLGAYTPFEWTNLVSGMEALPALAPPFAESVAIALNSGARLADFTSHQRTRTFIALARLLKAARAEVQFPAPLLATVTDPIAMSEFQPYQLVSLAALLGSPVLSEETAAVLTKALSAEVCQDRRLMSLSPQELTLISRSFEGAGLKSDPLLERIASVLVERFLTLQENRSEKLTPRNEAVLVKDQS